MRRDAVAVIVALGLAVSLVLLAGAAAWAEAGKNRVLSEAAASLLSTVLGAVVGAVATYLGLRPSEGDGAKASTRERSAPSPPDKVSPPSKGAPPTV